MYFVICFVDAHGTDRRGATVRRRSAFEQRDDVIGTPTATWDYWYANNASAQPPPTAAA